MQTADVIVVGLGAVGSAAAYHLARRGRHVIGLDRFEVPHRFGSSHGDSRIIRKAYFEGAHYLPLLERAYERWHDLEAETGQTLLRRHGALHIGPPDSAVVDGAKRSALTHNVPYEQLTARDVAARFPAFRLPPDQVAIYEPDAGLLHPEACIRAHLAEARRRGAELHLEAPVLRWERVGNGVRVATSRNTYEAAALVLCTGGWLQDLLPSLGVSLRIERQVTGWFRPGLPALQPPVCPVFIWEYEPGDVCYGLPDVGHGLKIGTHHAGDIVAHPDQLQREVDDADLHAIRTLVCRLLPEADAPPARAATCFYTNTPDQHYLIDRHPAHPQVVFASACSGHGFKASNAVGEALAEMICDGTSRLDLAAFSLDRFYDGGVSS